MSQQDFCCLCRRPVSGLGNRKLADGGRVCKTCLQHIEALPGGDTYAVTCEYDSASQVKAKVAQMEKTIDVHHQLEQLMAGRLAQFRKSRSFDVPDGMLIAVDDTHQLVRFNIAALDSWPSLMSVTLAISELVNATATDAPAVHVQSNVAGLPSLNIQVPVSDEGMSRIGSYLIGGLAGVMVAATNEEMRNQFGFQLAFQAAQFLKALINPPSNQPAQPAESPVDELIKWKSLLDSGGITQDEYDAKKKQLLGLD